MKQLIVFLLVILSVSVTLAAANPKDRLQIKRQLSTYVFTFPVNNTDHRLIESKTFNYNTDNPGIINSIAVHELEENYIEGNGWNTDWEYYNTYDYTATFSHLNGIYNYDYHNDIPPHAFMQVRDESYRIIDEDYSFSQYSRINRHFDQASRLDSLKYKLTNAVYGNKYLKLHYADGHNYAESITGYTIQNNIVTDSTQYSLNYGNTLTEHPVPLHMHEVAYLGTYTPYGPQFNYFNTPLLGDLLFISAVLNPVYQVVSYANLTTSQVQTITYEQITTGYHITVGNKEIWFDTDGYITRCHTEGWDGSYYGEKILEITWDTVVANEDQVQPVNLFSLVSYPNPFRQDVSIKFNNKVSIPSDLNIYNIKGQLVRSWKDVKSNELTWDGKDTSNQPVKSGIYLIKARQGNQISTAKVLKN